MSLKEMGSSIAAMKPSFLSLQMIDLWIEDHDNEIKKKTRFIVKQLFIINTIGAAFSIIVSLILSSRGEGIDWNNFLSSIPLFQSMFAIIFIVLFWENIKTVRKMLAEERRGWVFVSEKCKCKIPHVRMISEEDSETYKKLLGKDMGRGCSRCETNYKVVRVWKKVGKRYQKS